jgi:serine/threonine protein kinase
LHDLFLDCLKESEAEYRECAIDKKQPENESNYRHCIGLLGGLHLPFRSVYSSVNLPTNDDRRWLKESGPPAGGCTELLASIDRLRIQIAKQNHFHPTIAEWCDRSELGHGDSSIVTLSRSPNGTLIAVKTAATAQAVPQIQREAAIHEKLKHPLVLEFREYCPWTVYCNSAIVTEVAGNGSLASHLQSAEGALQSQLREETRVARIIVGIVLAMRYLHSQNIVYGDLRPDNILLDWNWNVKLCDFGHSLYSGESYFTLLSNHHPYTRWAYVDSHYLAPECYDNQLSFESDVFSFALILYELVVGKPPFSKSLKQQAIAELLIIEDARPDIPDFVHPEVGKLIRDCWTTNPDDRPSFDQILRRLERMDFKQTAHVNASKLSDFVKKIKDREQNCAQSIEKSSIFCTSSRHLRMPRVNVSICSSLMISSCPFVHRIENRQMVISFQQISFEITAVSSLL